MSVPIVLASSSIYRKEILERAGLNFSISSPNIDESALPEELPQDIVIRLAKSKAQKLESQYPNSLVIGCDQIADLNGEILGKPHDSNEAFFQLKKSSGSVLTLYCGISLLNTRTGNIQSDLDSFEVEYRKLSNQQISDYIEIAQPYDSCGGLKAEGIGIALLKRLTGNDPNTLTGLPLIKLIDLLFNEGITII